MLLRHLDRHTNFLYKPELVTIPNDNSWRFDARALYSALEAERRARGMSWQQVAIETGVSATTLTRTKQGGRLEVDGTLAMVRWLGRTIESFTHAAIRSQSPSSP
jgi:DNA-binding phage protein